MKAVIDFSYAAFVAAVIGIAVGGTAFSLVWLLSHPQGLGRRRGLVVGGSRGAASHGHDARAPPAASGGAWIRQLLALGAVPALRSSQMLRLAAVFFVWIASTAAPHVDKYERSYYSSSAMVVQSAVKPAPSRRKASARAPRSSTRRCSIVSRLGLEA